MKFQISDLEIDRMLERQKSDIIGLECLREIYIEDNGESLVKLLDYVPTAVIVMRESRIRFPGETLWGRESAVEALVEVAEKLVPNRLKIYDAFRPLEYQQMRHNMVLDKLRTENPDWTDEQVKAQAFILSSPPSRNLQTPPAHATGGAFDLTIADALGNDWDMGSLYGDFDSPLMYTNAAGLSDTQRESRITLIRLMGESGFMSFPGEWWHFSFGDREWSAYQGLEKAIYSRAEDPYKWR